MARLPWQRVTSPAPEDGDVYVTCSPLDLYATTVINTTGWAIDGRLDVDVLRKTAFEVVDHKYRRAGARLHRNQQKVLQFRIPTHFNDDDPPVAFSHQDYARDMPALPTSSHSVPWSMKFPKDLFRYLRSPKCPTKMSQYFRRQHAPPLLHIHVSTFSNGTFIGVTAPHILWDAGGLKIFMSAWTLTMTKSVDKVKEVPIGFSPLADPSWKQDDCVIPKGWIDPSTWQLFRFALSFAWRFVWSPREESRLVCVPKEWLVKAKQEAMDELKVRGCEWVASSDILLAWLYKTVYSLRNDERLVTVHFPLDLRPRFPDQFSQSYLNNAFSIVSLPCIHAHALARQPLFELALTFRRSIHELTSSTLRIRREVAYSLEHPGKLLLPCQPGQDFEIISSWRSVQFQELDFSAAAVSATKAKCCFVIGATQDPSPMPLRNTGLMMFENEIGAWLSVCRTRREWSRVKRQNTLLFLDSCFYV